MNLPCVHDVTDLFRKFSTFFPSPTSPSPVFFLFIHPLSIQAIQETVAPSFYCGDPRLTPFPIYVRTPGDRSSPPSLFSLSCSHTGEGDMQIPLFLSLID